MGQQVVAGAVLQCSFGAAPAALVVLPANRVLAGGPPAATIMDHAPMMNVPPFGMCSTPSNPMVAAATAAALGVLTPMPCIPVTAAPWPDQRHWTAPPASRLLSILHFFTTDPPAPWSGLTSGSRRSRRWGS